jgi:L-asparaginase II
MDPLPDMDPRAFAERAFAELAVVERDGFAESRHFGVMVGLAPDGAVAFALGDPATAILPRSAVKPWQALACVRAGLQLRPELIAVAVGSHQGEDRHVAAVREILAGAGLTESDLGCVPDWPLDETTRDRLIAGGQRRTPIRMNCSGKHAAMLATCVLHGWDISRYLDPRHPLQELVRGEVEAAIGHPVSHVTVDGCGAPLFGVSVLGLARAAQRMVTAEPGSTERLIADAMRSHPFYVGGTGNPNTELMVRMPGALAKGGAEGVIVAAGPQGQAVALKVIDGAQRATTPLALAGLGALGVDIGEAGELCDVPVRGGGRRVGSIRVTAALPS